MTYRISVGIYDHQEGQVLDSGQGSIVNRTWIIEGMSFNELELWLDTWNLAGFRWVNISKEN